MIIVASLVSNSSNPQDILKYTYLCLGKESIPFQKLVFFMSYDLKLEPPSRCEKILNYGKNEGLITISQDKIVSFQLDQLFPRSTNPSTMPFLSILKNMAHQAELDKSFGIQDNQVRDKNFDEKSNLLVGTIENKDGIPIRFVINIKEKVIIQEHENYGNEY